MADRKGRKSPVQTVDTTSRAGAAKVAPLHPTGSEKASPSASPKTTKVATAPAAGPTSEQIAQRAWSLWVKGGCMKGQDDKNWYEAEQQLKAEMGIR